MKKFLFALAVGVLSAIPASADEPKPTPAPPPTPVATPTTAPTMIYSSSTSTTRRGLLGRLRTRMNRGSSTITTTPYYSGTVITTPSTPTPSTGGTTVPTPMPSTTPGTKSGTNGTPAVVTGTPVVVAGGTTSPTPVMTTSATMRTSTYRMGSQRMGFIARLRARR